MKLIRIACLLSLVAFCSATVLAQNSFTVGTATAAPGQKATGTLEIPAGVDAAASIPVVVVRGSKPGPVLALVSGAHGTEYASIIALEKVIQSLDPAQVSGTVIILPLVNIASFEQKVPHVNPIDGKSMNRFYPGKQDGTQTERVSYAITKQVVERCDYLVDYHGGDIDENLRLTLTGRNRAMPSMTPLRETWCWPLAWTTSSSGVTALKIRRIALSG